MPDSETARLTRILAALEAHPAVAMAYRQNTGAARFGDDQRLVKFAYEGAADITGMLVGGRRLDVEVKNPGEWPTPETFARWERSEGYRGKPFRLTKRIRRLLAQKQNLDAINAGGGLGIVAYDVEDVYRELGHPADALASAPPAAVAKVATSRRRGRRWQSLPDNVKESKA